MWTKRDTFTMFAAALATFGATVGVFWPRILNAGGQMVAVANIGQPKLELGAVSVSAAQDPADGHRVILTLVNSGADPAPAQFTAALIASGPSSPMSRVGPRLQTTWSQQLSVDLKAGETKHITIEIPQTAFAITGAQQVQVQGSGSDAQAQVRVTIPGSAFLTLNNPQGDANGAAIRAISFAAEQTPVASR